MLPDLIRAYQETHRKYHTLDHIFYMINKAWSWHWEITDELCYAIWYHDYIYKIGAQNNEAESARLFEADVMKCGGLGELVDHEKVKQAIISTRDHIPMEALFLGVSPCQCVGLEAILIDLDLAILAEHQVSYERYVSGVRQEYHLFSDEQWVEGRSKWIKSMLKRDQIFYTEDGYKNCEKKSRDNLYAELKVYGEFL